MVPAGLKIYKNFDLSTLDSDNMISQDLYGGKVVPIGEKHGEKDYVWSTADMLWHHDRAYSPDCHSTVGLYCVAAEEGSSPTHFIDMVAAYNDAPEWLKEKAENQVCVNSVRKYMKQKVWPHNYRSKAHERSFRTFGKAEHPLVQENEYGKFFFYSPAYTETILEEYLLEHCIQEKYMYTHYWEPGDMLLYDNKSILHRRDETPEHVDRRHLRYALR